MAVRTCIHLQEVKDQESRKSDRSVLPVRTGSAIHLDARQSWNLRFAIPKFKPDNDQINRVPISDYPFLKPQPIGTAVQSFVIQRSVFACKLFVFDLKFAYNARMLTA